MPETQVRLVLLSHLVLTNLGQRSVVGLGGAPDINCSHAHLLFLFIKHLPNGRLQICNGQSYLS